MLLSVLRITLCMLLVLASGDRLLCAIAAAQSTAAPRTVDDARARAAGIRKITSRHLTLYTDLAEDAEVDRLAAAFDAAVLQWAAHCGVPAERTADWHVQGYLIADRRRFDALGLMPAGNDQFPHGISIGREVWLYEQPSPYYRRHLLLHEGTHAFMSEFLGACGPGWYMEGMAELLATHHWDDATGQLTLRTMPAASSEVPMLGRIKAIEDARAARRAMPLAAVLQIDNRRHLDVDAYAWCWAAARFLDEHPRYRERFRAMLAHTIKRDFNERFRASMAGDWSDLNIEWQVFIVTLDHGHDIGRTAIEFAPGTALPPRQDKSVAIFADRGWQSSGVWLEAGRTYRITADGRYQIAADPDGTPWPCEPGGVTLDYHAGRPLGMLLGAIDYRDMRPTGGVAPVTASPGSETTSRNGFLFPLSLGLATTLTPPASGTFYLQVNDSPGALADNAGELQVTIGAQ